MGHHGLAIELAHHQLAGARGRLPGDLLERIARRVLAQLAQVAAEAALAQRLHAEPLVRRARLQPLLRRREAQRWARQHLDAERRREVGLDGAQAERVLRARRRRRAGTRSRRAAPAPRPTASPRAPRRAPSTSAAGGVSADEANRRSRARPSARGARLRSVTVRRNGRPATKRARVLAALDAPHAARGGAARSAPTSGKKAR